jgi:hypothetical protein
MTPRTPHHAFLKHTVGWIGALFLAACGSTEGTTQDPLVTASDTLGTATDIAHAPELEGLMNGAAIGQGTALPTDLEAFRCDPSPQVTYTQVCGRSFPSSIHASWTSCAPRFGGPRGGDRQGPRGDGAFGSSGTVDITIQISASPADCSAGVVLTFTKTTTFNITRTGPRGSFSNGGTTTSTSARAPGAPTFTESTTVDTTRTRKDASGAVVRNVHLTGTLMTAFDRSSGTPSRTMNGTLDAQLSDGTTGTITLTNVTRSAGCHWPTAGTISRTRDGTTHTLVFGPACGEATLDGKTIPLRFGHHGAPGRHRRQ